MALGKIDALDILFQLFGQVSIPTNVHREVVIKGGKQGHIDAKRAQIAIGQNQLLIESVASLPPVIASLPLDVGEKEAIYLSTQESDSLILLDELKAREEAKRLGLTVKGTLGLLVQAYRENLISFAEIKAFIEAIIAHDYIWISADLCREVLKGIDIEY